GLPRMRTMLRKSGKPDLRWERAAQTAQQKEWVRGPLTQSSLLRLHRCPLPQGERAKLSTARLRLDPAQGTPVSRTLHDAVRLRSFPPAGHARARLGSRPRVTAEPSR